MDGTYLVLQGRVVQILGSDFILDDESRRTLSDTNTLRRALVHDYGDALTVNYANDYPGGLTLNGVASVTPFSPPPGKFSPVSNIATLKVHGDVSYETGGVDHLGKAARITLSLTNEIDKLQTLVAQLTERVVSLEAKVK